MIRSAEGHERSLACGTLLAHVLALALGIARRLKEELHEAALPSENGGLIAISCSVGIALYPDDAVDAKACSGLQISPSTTRRDVDGTRSR